MRLVVISACPPGGGHATFIESTAALAGAGHDVLAVAIRLMTTGGYDLTGSLAGLNVRKLRPEFRLGPALPGMGAVRDIRWHLFQRRLAEDLRCYGADWFVLHPCLISGNMSVPLWTKTNTCYMLQEPPRILHDALFRRLQGSASNTSHILSAYRPALDRRMVEKGSVVLVNSHFSRETVLRTYGRDARVVHLGLGCGADALHVGEAMASSEVAQKGYVLAVGGLEPVKNHELAVLALGLLPADRRPRLVLVSNRSNSIGAAALAKLAALHGVHIQVLGSVGSEELARLYRGAICTLCLSRLEPLGLTALESEAFGTAVVALCEGGFRETVIEGVTGHLVKPDPTSVADAVLRLIRKPIQVVGPARPDWATMAGEMISALEEFDASKRARRGS